MLSRGCSCSGWGCWSCSGQGLGHGASPHRALEPSAGAAALPRLGAAPEAPQLPALLQHWGMKGCALLGVLLLMACPLTALTNTREPPHTNQNRGTGKQDRPAGRAADITALQGQVCGVPVGFTPEFIDVCTQIYTRRYTDTYIPAILQ